MGAGSANAVAALIGLERELGRHGIPALPGPDRLRIAAEVGSDVPLFLVGGAVLGTGRGEEVSPLGDLPPTECVLALPDVGVSTPQAFRDWDELSAVSAQQSALQVNRGRNGRIDPPPGSDRLTMLSRAFSSAFGRGPGECPAGVGAHSSGVFARLAGDLAENPLLALVRTGIENDFEAVVFRQYPSLGNIKRILADSGNPEEAAVYAALSGSGSALFGLYGTPAAAKAAEERLREAGIRSLRTKTLPWDAYWRTMIER